VLPEIFDKPKLLRSMPPITHVAGSLNLETALHLPASITHIALYDNFSFVEEKKSTTRALFQLSFESV